ncbi:MAG TPA: response regulator [Planktothrix sp.]|jgi:CheY-like chemotaxis protein
MHKPRILVVEDDPLLRETIRRQLNKLGFESVLVESGEAAIETCNEDISMVFMDIGLPGIDGINATILIREKELHESRKRTPIVALSGHAKRQEAILVGMDDFLQKPALMADLKAMLDKYV